MEHPLCSALRDVGWVGDSQRGIFENREELVGKGTWFPLGSQMLGFQFFCLFLKASPWQAGLNGPAFSHVRLIIYLLMEL